MRGDKFRGGARTWTETPRETAAILMKRNATGNRENVHETVHRISTPE
jgi:hypothetical protein